MDEFEEILRAAAGISKRRDKDEMGYRKEIVKKIQKLSGKYSPYDIFTDWVTMMAISIQNGCDLSMGKVWKEREKQYKGIAGKYKSDEQMEFTAMFGMLVQELEENVSDVLGQVYMESGCGNKNTGQFFTPFHISVMCADMIIPEKRENGKIFLNEPSCGGGGMIIAEAMALKNKGEDYQSILDVVAQDLDWKAVYMCYVQLSLLGISAIVVQGNAVADLDILTYPPERVFRTPKKMRVII